MAVQNSLSLRKIKMNVPGKILMLLNAPYPADIRVKKEATALIDHGFEVFLICLRKKKQARTEVVDGIRVTRIDAGKNNYVLAFWDIVLSVWFVHPKFLSAAKRLIAEKSISFVHIHDLPLSGTALALKKSFPLKVVIDLHENYPEALKTWFKWKKNPIARLKNRMFLNPERWMAHERRSCLEADHVIAVVEEMKSRLIENYSIDPEKVTVVTNTEDKTFLAQPLNSSVYEQIPKGFTITYAGGIGPHRGVDTAIRGMALLVHLPLQLAIVGFGSPSVMRSLKNLVEDLKLHNVHFLGHQPFSKFYSYMHFADVNVIPHQSNGHTDNTVPHKLFQGMMAGKPLLVSSCAPLKRYVDAYRCGIVFKAGDAKDFAKQVELLYHDPAGQLELGKNGLKASVEGELNWDITQKELIKLYDQLDKSYG